MFISFTSFEQILLRGADEEELKKVKHVVQYAVFAAYHLALETSFLADEGASLPELPLNSLALPDKSSSIARSISTVPGFSVLGNEKSRGPEPGIEPRRTNSVPVADLVSLVSSTEPCLSNDPSQSMQDGSSPSHSTASFTASENAIQDLYHKKLLPSTSEGSSEIDSNQPLVPETSVVKNSPVVIVDDPTVNGCADQDILADTSENGHSKIYTNLSGSELLSPKDVQSHMENPGIMNEEQVPLKEEFPPSPSDHQSILVSLSSRCVWKGTVCERSHLFRIKYYGSFDKPLGRFLRDHLFDEVSLCSGSKCVCY